jgi:hypothetical protein
MLTADNVVHFMPKCGVVFVNQAVFATPGGAFRHLEAKVPGRLSRPVGQNQARTGFRHAKNVLQLKKVREFGGFFRCELRLLFTLHQFGNASLGFWRGVELRHLFGGRARRHKVDEFKINWIRRVHAEGYRPRP